MTGSGDGLLSGDGGGSALMCSRLVEFERSRRGAGVLTSGETGVLERDELRERWAAGVIRDAVLELRFNSEVVVVVVEVDADEEVELEEEVEEVEKQEEVVVEGESTEEEVTNSDADGVEEEVLLLTLFTDKSAEVDSRRREKEQGKKNEKRCRKEAVQGCRKQIDWHDGGVTFQGDPKRPTGMFDYTEGGGAKWE